MGSITAGGSRLNFLFFLHVWFIYYFFIYKFKIDLFSFIFLGKFTYFITYNFTM